MGCRLTRRRSGVMKGLTHAFVAWIILSLVIACGDSGGDGTAEPTNTPPLINTPIPEVTPRPAATPSPAPITDALQIRPGVFTTNEVGALPLPASGYDLYAVGETHGDRQVKLIFLAYLELLHEELGLRDVIVEEDQVYEREANAYVLGMSHTLRVDLCLRADVLKSVRAFNEQLAEEDKIRVHLVDVDSPLPAIYAHLNAARDQIGEAAHHIQIPPLNEFEGWSQNDALRLVEQLEGVAGDRGAVINALGTVRYSLHYYFAGNRIGIGPPVGSPRYAPIREDAITRNIQHLLGTLNGAPMLALFGSSHTQKFQGVHTSIPELQDFKPWAQRLTESGVNIYSVAVWGLSGQTSWRGTTRDPDWGAGQIQFSDGTTLDAVLNAAPNDRIVYADLRLEANASARFGGSFEDIPAGEIYDGFVVFRAFTPMENACP